jgi:ABC-type thiamin/hydroxymethylpyrimidine transport system permease subunit
MLIFLIAGAVGGATSAFYLAYNYHPLLLNGAIHGVIFVSPLVAMYFVKKLNVRTIGLYLAGALPVHLAIHFTIIGDLAQLIGVSHILLNFLSLP